MKFCPVCQASITDDAVFCHLCGAKINTNLNASEQNSINSEIDFQNNKAQNDYIVAEKSNKKSIRIIFLSIISLIIIVSIIVGSCFLFSKSEKSTNIKPLDYALFIKYDELYYSDLKKIEKNSPIQITSKLFDVDSSDDSNFYAASEKNIHITADNKIFYIDKLLLSSAETEYDYVTVGILYCKDLSKPEQEPVKIDSDVADFSVNPSASFVTYTKYTGNQTFSLYKYNLKKNEREKLVENAYCNLCVFNYGEKTAYIYEWAEFYSVGLVDASGNNHIVERDISQLVNFSSDLSTVYFIKNDILYKKTIGEEKEIIMKDVSRVLSLKDENSFYYSKAQNKTFTYLDFVNDEYYEKDKNMKEPYKPEYPEYDENRYSSYSEYTAAVDKYYDIISKNRELYAEYEAKLKRDEIREELRNKEIGINNCSLYYYDGTQSSLISDKYVYCTGLEEAAGIIIFKERKHKEITQKVDLYADEITEKISEAISEFNSCDDSEIYCIKGNIFGETINPYDSSSNINNLHYDYENDKYYYISENDLYSLTIDENNNFKSTLYDTNVYNYSLTVGGIMYIKDKNQESQKGELYLNKKFIDYDVYAYNSYLYSDGEIIYYTDWSSKTNSGTLKFYKNENAVKISDDVHDYDVLSNGDILYLSNYNTEFKKGELMKYSKNESVKVDSDVMAIIKNRGDRTLFW